MSAQGLVAATALDLDERGAGLLARASSTAGNSSGR
jgi:hypothetical protein